MSEKDIRWKQRFSNYQKALAGLGEFIQQKTLNKLEKQGAIQAFEYTHELAWKVLADFIKDKGNAEIFGSKDATREAFSLGLIHNGTLWMDMIKNRNLTSHTYNQELADEIVTHIVNEYYSAFCELEIRLKELL